MANSYKNSSNYLKAIEHFEKRISLGGWIEENWYSRYELGKCYMQIGKEAAAIQTWLEAYGYHPKRAENLYEIVKHYRISFLNWRYWHSSFVHGNKRSLRH